MYQSRKKQVNWQFEFKIPDSQQMQPTIVLKQQPNIAEIEDKHLNQLIQENQIQIQAVKQDEKQIENKKEEEQINNNQSQIKKIIPVQTKSKNYYLQKKQIYLINNIQVCDQECQYSPKRLSLFQEKENNAYLYTIEKDENQQQFEPADDELNFKQNVQKQQQENEEHIITPNLKETELEFLQQISNLQNIIKQDQTKKGDGDAILLKYYAAQLDSIKNIRENRQLMIAKLIQMLKETVDKQNQEIKVQQDIVNNFNQNQNTSNKKSIALQTPKQYEIEQNYLPQLLGYTAQSIEQDLINNQYIVTYQLKRGYVIITFKTLKKIKQSEDLNKIMTDFAEKFYHKHLQMTGLDLRIQGYQDTQLPYEQLVQSAINSSYLSDGRLAQENISNIVNLLPHMIKKLRQLEKQLFILNQYGCLWTLQFEESKILILLGYRTLLKKQDIYPDQVAYRVDYDLLTFKYEFQYDLTRQAILIPFYPKMDIKYLKEGKALQIDQKLFEKLRDIEMQQRSITEIFRVVNSTYQK